MSLENITEEASYKKKRHDKFEELKKKADEIATVLSLSQKEYTLDDYMSFSFITMMNACTLLPQLTSPVKSMINFWIDGQIQIEEEKEEKQENGLLSQQKE